MRRFFIMLDSLHKSDMAFRAVCISSVSRDDEAALVFLNHAGEPFHYFGFPRDIDRAEFRRLIGEKTPKDYCACVFVYNNVRRRFSDDEFFSWTYELFGSMDVHPAFNICVLNNRVYMGMNDKRHQPSRFTLDDYIKIRLACSEAAKCSEFTDKVGYYR